jgi:signal peptidase I
MIEVLKQALEALEELRLYPETPEYFKRSKAITSLRQAIAGLESQEPVAWMSLMKEARDNCKASIVEDGISEMRKEYRIDLERRLTDCINTHPPQRTEQEPVAYKWSDAGDLKLLKKGDVLRVLRKGQEYYRAFKFCGAIEECDYAYDGNAPFAWLLVGMAYTDKIVYTRKNFSTGAVYADRGDVVEIRQPINYPTPPQRTEQEPVAYCEIHHLPEPCVQCAKEHEGYNTHPPQRTWMGLTDDEMQALWKDSGWYVTMFKAVEAKLKEKNT